MARMRSVKPEFFIDRKLARKLSRDARLLYIGLWTQADEHARLNGDPRLIKGNLLPYEDDIDLAAIERLLGELEDGGFAVRYEVDEDPYLYLPKLSKHQRLESEKVPSRLPSPPRADSSERRANESARDAGSSESRSSAFRGVSERREIGTNRAHGEAGSALADERREDSTQTVKGTENAQVTPQSARGANESAPRADELSLKHVASSREHVAGVRRADELAPDGADKPRTPSKSGKQQTEADRLADEITRRWWDERKAAGNAPAQAFPAARSVVRTALGNGVNADELQRALPRISAQGFAISGGTIETALGQLRRTGQRAPASSKPPVPTAATRATSFGA